MSGNSLKANVVANYVGQIYLALIGVVMLPVYVRYLGAESFGLVGFFGVLQVWFQLFDLGLSQTLTREAARYKGGSLGAREFNVLFRTMEAVFAALAVVGGVALFLSAPWLAAHWLKLQMLQVSDVGACIQMMALISAIRLFTGPYRSILMGFEHQVWVNGFGVIVGTIRGVAVIALLVFVNKSAYAYFSYQLVVGCAECAILVWRARTSLPPCIPRERVFPDFSCLRKNGAFAFTIAFTSSAWLVVSYSDRLILSKILPLSEFGYYAVAVTLANAVNLIGAPVGLALLPRMVGLVVSLDDMELFRLYHKFTQFVCWLAFSAALLMACFSWPILWVWTGNVDLANYAALPLRLYALGNGVLAVSAFPYYLQYAKGDVSLHLYGNILFLVVFVPLVVIAGTRFGAVGAGYVWLGVNLLYFAVWVPLVHRKFAPKVHATWFVRDILVPLAPLAGTCLLCSLVLPVPQSRLAGGVQILAVGIVVVAVGAVALAPMRHWMTSFCKRVLS